MAKQPPAPHTGSTARPANASRRPEAVTTPRAVFLAALFGGCEGIVEFRALPSKARDFFRPDDGAGLSGWLAANQSQNLYFGVATRCDASSGALGNCLHLRALFSDIDFKMTAEPEARQRLAEFPLRPSAILNSGGGLHVYWFLRMPLELPGAAEQAKGILRRLAAALGGDLSAAEPARILRVPGTRNRKYDPPRQVTIESFNPKARYTLEELEGALPPEPVGATPGKTRNAPGWADPFIDGVSEGTRDDTCYRLIGRYARLTLSRAEVVAFMLSWAAKCVPPFDEARVLEKIERAFAESSAGEPTHERPCWEICDAADVWDVPPIEHIVDDILPRRAVVWMGGTPKAGKSLWVLYEMLAICTDSVTMVAGKFRIRSRPTILYVAREDSLTRIQGRRDDILSVWGDARPLRGRLRFLAKQPVDLLNPAHVAEIRDLCRRDSIGVLVLDTWTALSPGADPTSPKDQAGLAEIVKQLATDIDGCVLVVDHTRKNRPEGTVLSAADIYGPNQKWAAAEHVIMLAGTETDYRHEMFIEGKDGDTLRFFVERSPRGVAKEKYTYAGSTSTVAERSKSVGTSNREVVYEIVAARPAPMSPREVVEVLIQRGTPLALPTVRAHLSALSSEKNKFAVRRLERVGGGNGRQARYRVLAEGPSQRAQRVTDES